MTDAFPDMNWNLFTVTTKTRRWNLS